MASSAPSSLPMLVGVSAEQKGPGTVLEALGLTDREEDVYRVLVDAPRTAEALTEALGRPVAPIADDLAALQARGLVSRLPGPPVRYAAAPPAVALGSLLTARREELRVPLAVPPDDNTWCGSGPTRCGWTWPALWRSRRAPSPNWRWRG
ncbi:helix-turn-helix domain-containing protein [Nonomuraea sp. K274]|uniref:Helix-turn-helix domain-containing protein n=1 Tax=Nonomuraea cypriaca TaxID=1187855 RepID=A0A931A9Y8_9ACTN|nr:helix-turn-helix domain-containing protein [Nonomuraea cypriaca]MBF8187963.1 helix-turn-helix domain-containing protein [Nonomuraea cypriaca]